MPGATGATESFLIPWDEGDKAIHDQKRSVVDQALAKIATEQSIRQQVTDLVIRDALPGTDLSINNGGSASEYLEAWVIPDALTAGTDDTYISAALPNDRAVAFYSVGSPMASPAITKIQFKNGATVTAVYQTQRLFVQQRPYGYFNTYQAYLPNQTVTVTVMPRYDTNANSEELIFGARTVEPFGKVISSGVN